MKYFIACMFDYTSGYINENVFESKNNYFEVNIPSQRFALYLL